MPFTAVLDLCDYFRRFPPPHLALRQLTQLVAAFMGVKLDTASGHRAAASPAAPTQTEQAVMARAQSGMDRSMGVIPPEALPPHVRQFMEERKKARGIQ
jgi:hypothetical protein